MSSAAERGGRSRSVRYRLLAIALVPMLIVLPLLLGIGIYRWNLRFNAMMLSKVNDDLTIAHQYLARIRDRTEGQLTAVTEAARFQDLLRRDDAPNGALAAFLANVAAERDLDFLYVVADDGRVVVSDRPMGTAPIRWNWPAIGSALKGRPKAGIEVFDEADLAAISPELALRARVEIVSTESSVASAASVEPRGLMLQGASPVELPGGKRGALVGGILLNRNLPFVDGINDLIYHGSGLPEGSRGTVTLFLGDVRVSTNVRMFEGQRAIGTRVSAEVRSAVLDQGRVWRDSAFVVDDWYVSAYEPILDSAGRRVGMLYAGFLEKPFTEAKRETLLAIAAAFLIALFATVPLFLHWAGAIFRPLERMSDVIARVRGGDPAARTGPVASKDEIGEVALHLDHLLDLVQERDAELRRWNEELNQRVEERARALQLTTTQLETTTRQLVMSEKLAAIGEITAGVAHEINNPIAVMQGNLEVIRQLMGAEARQAQTEFRLIEQQMDRVSEIVTKLLQFAKPQEYAGYTEHYAVAGIISDTLPLVQHLLKKSTIEVEREDRAIRPIMMNRTELQQVLVNLIVNAIHAMPDGGRLGLRTFDSDMDRQDGVAIQISDTGTGMTPEVMRKVFDPFFTTKRREGTGLGLSISQMLATRQGGKISVESEPGLGTTFTIWLPAAR